MIYIYPYGKAWQQYKIRHLWHLPNCSIHLHVTNTRVVCEFWVARQAIALEALWAPMTRNAAPGDHKKSMFNAFLQDDPMVSDSLGCLKPRRNPWKSPACRGLGCVAKTCHTRNVRLEVSWLERKHWQNNNLHSPTWSQSSSKRFMVSVQLCNFCFTALASILDLAEEISRACLIVCCVKAAIKVHSNPSNVWCSLLCRDIMYIQYIQNTSNVQLSFFTSDHLQVGLASWRENTKKHHNTKIQGSFSANYSSQQSITSSIYLFEPWKQTCPCKTIRTHWCRHSEKPKSLPFRLSTVLETNCSRCALSCCCCAEFGLAGTATFQG